MVRTCLNSLRLLAALLVIVMTVATAQADDARAFVNQHCVVCHGDSAPSAGLRLDLLETPSAENAAVWAQAFTRVRIGDMPPPDSPRPDTTSTHQWLKAISGQLAAVLPPADAVRRMNRLEYENTLHDLLGIDVPLASLLPEDGRVQGFDNVATGLGISSILMERYLEAADVAFNSTIRRIKPLPPETRRAVLMDIQENIDSVEKNKGGVISADGAFVDFTPGWPPARIDPSHPIEPGIYRCRVAVWPHNPGAQRTLSVAIFTGPLFGPGERRFQGMFDVTGTAAEPRIIEFTTRLEEGHTLHVLPWIYPEHVTWRDKEEARPGVAFAWAETYGPLDQEFPSAAQTLLLGQSDSIQLAEKDPLWMRHRRGVKLHEVESSDAVNDIRRIITHFAKRAFRRPVEAAVTDAFVNLALERYAQAGSFEHAIRAGVSAVLCSPYFLLINREPVVDDYTIAERLSYFLWSSMPDETLLELAAANKLSDPAVRHQQVERMLADSKSERFVENFTNQWLDLRNIEFTTPAAKLYPEYSELLLRSMLGETRGFFRHMLREDLSVKNFVDSDVACLNQRLAEHYGIDGIRGHEEFRIVALPESNVRGGILTHASVLKVTANGTSTSPVTRGTWVLDKLFSQPAPPPPPGVPAVEPDIRGTTTLRDQLAAHRTHDACNRCHVRIDPHGFALEEFDVIGGHRERYRSVEGKGPKVPKTNYYHGLPVEAHGALDDGRNFQNFLEYRGRLLQDPELLARGIAEKLLVYGCGRPVTATEYTSIDAVVSQTAKHDYGLTSMIHAVVDSELFLRP